MRYDEWFKIHQQKHQQVLAALEGKSIDEIIDYFDYENMQFHEPNFCPLYKENKKCHDMKELNCYLCGCPNFRYDDEGMETEASKTLYSKCAIHSKDGKQFITEDAIHHDCSECILPHTKEYVKKYFYKAWK